jgi:hypothetical protein
MTEWKIDYEKDEMDPDDSEGPIEFWWEDMRRSEMVKLIMDVYERGKSAGKKEKM